MDDAANERGLRRILRSYFDYYERSLFPALLPELDGEHCAIRRSRFGPGVIFKDNDTPYESKSFCTRASDANQVLYLTASCLSCLSSMKVEGGMSFRAST